MKVLLQQTRVNQKLLLCEESQIHLQMPWQWRNLLPLSIWNVQESSMPHMCKFSEEVIEIPADNQYPDCPFIEDTAIVIGNQALITRPVCPSFDQCAASLTGYIFPVVAVANDLQRNLM
jgi:hypothetical protein